MSATFRTEFEGLGRKGLKSENVILLNQLQTKI